MLGPRPIRDPVSKRRLTAPKVEIQVVLWHPHRCVLTCTPTNVHRYTHMSPHTTHTHTEVDYTNPDYVLDLHFQASLALFSPLYTPVSKELRLKSAQKVCVCVLGLETSYLQVPLIPPCPWPVHHFHHILSAELATKSCPEPKEREGGCNPPWNGKARPERTNSEYY